MTRPLLLRDLSLRLAGLALLAGAAMLLMLLFRGTAARGPASTVDMIEAAGGFLGASTGAGLLLLGHHIHDRVSVSSQWVGSRPRSRRGPPA